jgi:purine catabolism regulator
MSPSFSVADALDLDVFRIGGATVVCGHESLNRVVRWAHLGEVFDITPYLRGGELLLLSSHFLSTTDQYGPYVDAVTDIGVAALVVELSPSFRQVPLELTARAAQQRLPVIAFPRPVRFIEITEQVHSAILDRQYSLLAKADSLARDLTALPLEGLSLHRVVARVAEVLGTPVVVEDAAHHIVDYGTAGREIAWLLQGWDLHSRDPHQLAGTRAGSPVTGECIWFPLVVRGSTWGRVHVLEFDGSLNEPTRMVIDRAATALSLTLLGDDDSTRRRDAVGSELLFRLRDEPAHSIPPILAEASALGVELRDRRLVAVMARLGRVNARENPPRSEHIASNQLLVSLRNVLGDEDCVSLAGLDGDCVAAIVAAKGTLAAGPVADGAMHRLVEDWGHRDPTSSIEIGVSNESTVEELREAFDQAGQALAVAGSRREADIVHFSDAGLARLLASMSETWGLARFVEDELGPLLESDARRRTQFIATTQAFLDLNGNRSAVARALFLRRPSLYKRLRRIEHLLGRSLDDARTRAALYVALEARALLEHDDNDALRVTRDSQATT